MEFTLALEFTFSSQPLFLFYIGLRSYSSQAITKLVLSLTYVYNLGKSTLGGYQQ